MFSVRSTRRMQRAGLTHLVFVVKDKRVQEKAV
jgi:hypothetical protein